MGHPTNRNVSGRLHRHPYRLMRGFGCSSKPNKPNLLEPGQDFVATQKGMLQITVSSKPSVKYYGTTASDFLCYHR